VKADALVFFVMQDEKAFASATKKIAAEFSELKALLASGDFNGKRGQTALTYTNGAGVQRLILVGLGDAATLTNEGFRRAAAAATKRAASSKCNSVAYEVPVVSKHEAFQVAKAITEGASLSQYGFVKYKTSSNDHFVTKFTLVTTAELLKTVKKGTAEAEAIITGVMESRNLANAPNNEIYPTTLGSRAAALGRKYGFKTTVLNKKKIQDLKMGGLLGVNQGSVRPPVFIVMEYNGGQRGEKPIVLVGKGVTFDTGGISLKPSPGMSDMKSDMHGAATVIGTMVTMAQLGVKKNIVALVPATENMPSGTAVVPGDILTFMNGKTAEIDNTDAEGRLILADALCYADRFKPEVVIDLATLTGAVVIALGNTTTGMMGTDDSTMNKLRSAATETSEYVCELPLYEEYEELISSDYADVKNSGGRAAGSITAALFLKKFVSYPWVHLDIAGTGIAPKAGHYSPKGATGVGVRLLTNAIQNW